MSRDDRLRGVKIAQFKIDASDDAGVGLAEGQFTGYASVFGNKDSYGDIVRPGAFLKSLANYGEKGSGIPAYWSHRMDDPMMNIGKTIEAKEDEHGLFVKVQLDLDNPNGAQAHKLIKEGRVSQMSFAYTVKDYAWGDSEEHGEYLELKELDLHEVSLVPIGANQATELLDVKSSGAAVLGTAFADVKSITNAISLLKAALDAFDAAVSDGDGDESVDESADDETEGKSDELNAAKDDDLTGSKSVGVDESDMITIQMMLATAGIHIQ